MQSVEPEDYAIQSMPDASPVKWHLAHNELVLRNVCTQASLSAYRSFASAICAFVQFLLRAAGPRWPRLNRMLSRPTVADVMRYRRHIDQHMSGCWRDLPAVAASPCYSGIITTVTSELILTDLKHQTVLNPLQPVQSGEPCRRLAMPRPELAGIPADLDRS